MARRDAHPAARLRLRLATWVRSTGSAGFILGENGFQLGHYLRLGFTQTETHWFQAIWFHELHNTS